MLEKINALEEKLDSLIHRMTEMRAEVKKRTRESDNLKKKISRMKKAGTDSDGHQAASEISEQLEEALEENRELKKHLSDLEKELEERAALEEETLKKLKSILARIDILEAEIGGLQNE